MKNSTTNSKKIIEYVAFCIGILLIGFVIQLLQIIKGDNNVFPTVGEVLACFFKLLGEAETYKSFLITILYVIASLAIASLIGISLGFIAGYHKIVEKILQPFMIFFRSLPMIILVVILMLILNKGSIPILACSLTIVPIIYEATKEGIKNIEKEYIDAYKIYSKTNLYIIFKVQIPMISGYFKQAYSNAIGMSIKVIVTVGYIVGLKNSYGQDIINSRVLLEFDKIYAYALLLILMVSLLELLPRLIAFVYKKIKYKEEV